MGFEFADKVKMFFQGSNSWNDIGKILAVGLELFSSR